MPPGTSSTSRVASIGRGPDEVSPLPRMLSLNAAVFELDDATYKRRLRELDGLLGLDPLWHTPVKKMSLGQRMKMELACSLIHDPELLLLDEPTIGLDVVMQKTLRDFVARINREKKTTVLLTSHNMEDIESLCRRVIVIHNGALLFDGDLPELARLHRTAILADYREGMARHRLADRAGPRHAEHGAG